MSPRILLTRPAPDNQGLAELLLTLGYDIRILPMLEIRPLKLNASDRQTVYDIDHFPTVIVTSKHAAGQLVNLLDEYWPQAPVGINWIAVGRKTARSLATYQLTVQSPSRQDSEGILDLLTSLENQGTRLDPCLLVKGRGGRQLLPQELKSRGIRIQSLDVYERVPVSYSAEVLADIFLDWRPAAILVYSGETFTQLWSLTKQFGYSWKKLILFVPSPRVARIVHETIPEEDTRPQVITLSDLDEAAVAAAVEGCLRHPT